MRWMNLWGVDGGDKERRWGFGGSSVMRVFPASVIPWRWSLEEGEPSDCLCIVLNSHRQTDREVESETQKLPECRERERERDTERVSSVNFVILILLFLYIFLFFCVVIFI
jgi:hypothetical protein